MWVPFPVHPRPLPSRRGAPSAITRPRTMPISRSIWRRPRATRKPSVHWLSRLRMTPSGLNGSRTASSAVMRPRALKRLPRAKRQAAPRQRLGRPGGRSRGGLLAIAWTQIQGPNRRDGGRLARNAPRGRGAKTARRYGQQAVKHTSRAHVAMHPRGAPLQRRRAMLARLQGQRTGPVLPQSQQAQTILSLEFRNFAGKRGVPANRRIDHRDLASDGVGIQETVFSGPKFRGRECLLFGASRLIGKWRRE